MTRSLTFLTAAVLLAAPALAQDGKDDAKNIVGTWKVVAGELQGMKQKAILGHRMVFEKDALQFQDEKGEAIPPKTRYELRPDKTPPEIDIIRVQAEGDKEQKQVAQGIYELKGDKLRLCYGQPGKERPTEFKTAEGDGRAMAELERVEAKTEKKEPVESEKK